MSTSTFMTKLRVLMSDPPPHRWDADEWKSIAVDPERDRFERRRSTSRWHPSPSWDLLDDHGNCVSRQVGRLRPVVSGPTGRYRLSSSAERVIAAMDSGDVVLSFDDGVGYRFPDGSTFEVQIDAPQRFGRTKLLLVDGNSRRAILAAAWLHPVARDWSSGCAVVMPRGAEIPIPRVLLASFACRRLHAVSCRQR